MMKMFLSCRGVPDDILYVDRIKEKDYVFSSLAWVLLKRDSIYVHV